MFSKSRHLSLRMFWPLFVVFIFVAMNFQENINHNLSKLIYVLKPNNDTDTDDCRRAVEKFITLLDSKDEFIIAENDFNLSKSLVAKKRNLLSFANCPIWIKPHMNNKTLSKCRKNQCVVSYGTQLIPESDAVIFHGVDLHGSPPRRPLGQPWVLFNLESPIHTRGTFGNPEWREAFNWTMTYNIDSDFFVPYGLLIPRRRPPSYDYLLNVVKKKKKSASWFVSNCHSPSKRSEYVHRLKKVTDVDIFGLCGPKRCGIECLQMLNSTYKFYLSFENTFCRDYVTEKLFKTFTSHVIAVVRGGANYTALLPKGTYVNAADYETPEDLGNYLNYLDRNITAYMEILARKEQYDLIDLDAVLKLRFCEVCNRLATPEPYRKKYKDMGKWFVENACHAPTDLRE